MMKTIGDLLSRDLSRKIEEIIQVDQADEQSVHDEITEYIATDSIREQYHDLLKAIADAPSEPHESVGVWVSGFFGSGKSSFAKNLGYALENRKVLGHSFADLFKQQLHDPAKKDTRIGAILHELDRKLYPSADSWAHSQRNRDASISVSKVVKRTFDLWGRRRKGQALVFIIDEVGQHVARSGDKIEDLRATIEEFGRVGKNRLKAKKIKAPCWIVVTSQEKLDEVVAAIDSKRVDLAKLQDRFHHRVDLAPSDIREVATKRVLAKKPGDKSTDAIPVLRNLFQKNEG